MINEKEMLEIIEFEKDREENWNKGWSEDHQAGYIKALEMIYTKLFRT